MLWYLQPGAKLAGVTSRHQRGRMAVLTVTRNSVHLTGRRAAAAACPLWTTTHLSPLPRTVLKVDEMRLTTFAGFLGLQTVSALAS